MEPWRVRTTVPRTHHNVPHSYLAFSRDRSASPFPPPRRGNREFLRKVRANSVSQPPSSNDSRATNRFDSLVFRRNQLIERRAKIRADTGSVKDRLMGLKRLERVGMKTAAWRSIEELIRGANVLFGESV